MKLRVFDLNTPWFWLTLFYYPEHYGKPFLELSLWNPHTFKKWWIHGWIREQIPDETQGFLNRVSGGGNIEKPDFHEIWKKVDKQAREKFEEDTKHLHIDDYVAWCRYTKNSIVTCDSDAPGAFKVYRHSQTPTPRCTRDPNTCAVAFCGWPNCAESTP